MKRPVRLTTSFGMCSRLLLLQRRRLRLDGTKTIDEQEFLEVTGTRGEGTFLVPDQQLNDTEVQELQNAVFGT